MIFIDSIKNKMYQDPIKDLKVSDEDKRKWMEEYVQLHKLSSYDIVANPGFSSAKMKTKNDLDPYNEEIWDDEPQIYNESNFPNILPISMRVAARTIGREFVTVNPMGSPEFKYTEKPKKEINRIYSDLDPYGEEDWDN